MSDEAKQAIKARMFIGGLKSMFGNMHDALTEVEKDGVMPRRLFDELLDVKDAIEMTLNQLYRAQAKCCDHDEDDHQHHHDEDDEDDGISDDEDGDYDEEEEEVTKPRRKHEED